MRESSYSLFVFVYTTECRVQTQKTRFNLLRELAEEEVTHLFAAADDNHDNNLSYDEIVNHYDIFVGSEVTDYGEHLVNMDRFRDEL